MSLNIADSLADKLYFPLKGYENPLIRKFTGSQNLLGGNDKVFQRIPSVYHEPIHESGYISTGFSPLNRSMSDSKMNSLYSLETNHKLVSQAPKLVSPVLTSLHASLSAQQKHFDKVKNSNSYLSYNSFVVLYTAMESESAFPNMLCSLTESFKNVSHKLITMSAGVSNIPKEDVAQPVPVAHSNKCAPPVIKSPPDCNNLNDEMVNRKAKELQKRSKKRRRRQKKNKAKSSKCNDATLNMKTATGLKVEPNLVQPSRKTVSENREGAKCDILCDIMKLTGKANSVQILLPDSSFLITVESGCEDDSDWDNNTCSDILTDCAEFEFSGLFVTNLTPSRTSSFITSGCTSPIPTPSIPEHDFEMSQLESLLRRVNKNWIEATKDVEAKPKVTTKVSFAPDDKLVDFVLVEMYNRKGEWEVYATERLRFKRRIDELEGILSPCLSVEHRQNVFNKLYKSNL